MRKNIDILKEELEEAIDFQKTEDQELAEFFNDCLEWLVFLQTMFNLYEQNTLEKEFEVQHYKILLEDALKILEEIQQENKELKERLKQYEQ